MLGWTPAKILGRHMHRLLHHSKEDGSPYPEQDCPIYAALKDGTVHAIYHEVFWTKAGKLFPVEYLSTPIRKRGDIVGAVVTFTDRLKCEVAREALRVFAENPRTATEFSEWCVQPKAKKERGGSQRKTPRIMTLWDSLEMIGEDVRPPCFEQFAFFAVAIVNNGKPTCPELSGAQHQNSL